MNQQRKAIYALRREVLGGADAEIREKMLDLIETGVIMSVDTNCPPKQPVEKWDLKALEDQLKQMFGAQVNLVGVDLNREALENRVYKEVENHYLAKER